MTGKEAADCIRALGLEKGTIAIEKGFLPADAFESLRSGLPDAAFTDALFILEELRAVKRPEELALLKEASEHIIGSMTAIMRSTPAGTATREIAGNIGLSFWKDYLLTLDYSSRRLFLSPRR
ncbi:MAG: aminopeptidase P family N-terminal domain-containing protein [candidate division Zixibacteria bacterium]|nr:aminopeptidase P family N-terminal domain-containing protein [candidate division Zixibacteria bacterium]